MEAGKKKKKKKTCPPAVRSPTGESRVRDKKNTTFKK